MSTNWRKLGLFLIGVGALYVVVVGVVADFSQVLSLKHGGRLLVLLFVVALGYKGWELGQRFWRNYCALQARLDEVRNLIRRYGDVVLLCAQARWLYQQHGQSIRVRSLQSEGVAVLDVSQVPLGPDDNLVGVHFAIIGFDGGQRARGQVRLYNSAQACLELHQIAGVPSVGDLAIPIEPPHATNVERLLGNILFIVNQRPENQMLS